MRAPLEEAHELFKLAFNSVRFGQPLTNEEAKLKALSEQVEKLHARVKLSVADYRTILAASSALRQMPHEWFFAFRQQEDYERARTELAEVRATGTQAEIDNAEARADRSRRLRDSNANELKGKAEAAKKPVNAALTLLDRIDRK